MSADEYGDPHDADEGFTLGSPHPHDPDAPPVGPTFAGPFAIGGGVKGVNDAGSVPTEVRITRHEAEELYRHWFTRMRDAEESCLVHETSGFAEWREVAYALYRLAELVPHVPAELLDELQEEARRRDAALRAGHEAYLRSLDAEREAYWPDREDAEGDEPADPGDGE